MSRREESSEALISRGKRRSLVWFLVCVPAGGAATLALLIYESRFGLPVQRMGNVVALIVLFGVVFGPVLFFGLPAGKKARWEATAEESQRLGVKAMAAFAVACAIA